MTSRSKTVHSVETDGKAFLVMRAEGSVLFRIGLEGGGVVPEQLKGLYTSQAVAENDINKYLESRS